MIFKTNLKEVSKTLKFKLIPQGNTKLNFEKFLAKDKDRADSYSIVKEMIDHEFRTCINTAYKNSIFDFENLKKAYESNQLELINKTKKEYYKILEKKIYDVENFKSLFKKEFVNILKNRENISESEKKSIDEFDNFTSYFIKYQENRKNVFSTEDINTSLFFRMIDTNFSKYINNRKVVLDILNKYPEIIDETEIELKKYNFIDEKSSLVNDYFTVNSYNKYLLQDGIDLYNTILGGNFIGDIKVKGLNEQINLFNQKNKFSIKYLNYLDKQILSESDERFIDYIENDRELLEKITNIFNTIKDFNLINNLDELFEKLKQADIRKIYLSSKEARFISYKKFGDPLFILTKIKDLLKEEAILEKSGKKLTKKEEEKIYKQIGYIDEDTVKDKFISINKIIESLKNKEEEMDFLDYYIELFREYISDYSKNLENVKNLIDNLTVENIKKDINIEIIKSFLDSIIFIRNKLNSFNNKDIVDFDGGFYNKFYEIYDKLKSINTGYNLIRNYVTKVNYSKNKIKINFNFPTFGNGWSKSKEKDNKGIILKKDGKYYLGIILDYKKVDIDNIKSGQENYQKMDYFLFPGVNKMIPKCLFTNDVKKHFKSSNDEIILSDDVFLKPFAVNRELFDTFQKEYDGKKKFQKDYLRNNPKDFDGYRNSLNVAINGSLEFLKSYKNVSIYDFSKLKKTEEYENIQDFYSDIENLTYKIQMRNVDSYIIDKFVEDGDILLFQLYNKDFSEYSTGRDNLHTMYLKSLFSEENLSENKIRLAGNSEVFFREKSIEDPVIHYTDDRIINKTYIENGIKKSVPDEIIVEINSLLNQYPNLSVEQIKSYASEEALKYIDLITIRSTNIDIVKDRRFTVDQLEFHFPIKINFGKKENINNHVDDIIRNIEEINIIGIDRGERNLLYICLINNRGEIIEQKSLNIINGIDYNQKLSSIANNRKEQRKEWKTIDNIKNVKEGYLSLVISEISRMAVENNALIVMENLNIGFKNSRLKIEKQVYQKFETMLSNKLNYLVFKEKEKLEKGGILNGYQLSNSLDLYSSEERNGIILYIPAKYTSKIDPVTGFVNLFAFRSIKNNKDIIEFVNKIDSIIYDDKLDMFRYSIDYSKFDRVGDVFKKKWDIYTNGTRFVNDRINKKTKEVDLTKSLKDVLEEKNIDFYDGKELKEIILEDLKLTTSFFGIFKLSVQLRSTNQEKDIIISPILSNGKFFISGENLQLPIDADANGAYNIALKGLMAVKKFRENEDLRLKTMISKNEWLEFMQK